MIGVGRHFDVEREGLGDLCDRIAALAVAELGRPDTCAWQDDRSTDPVTLRIEPLAPKRWFEQLAQEAGEKAFRL